MSGKRKETIEARANRKYAALCTSRAHEQMRLGRQYIALAYLLTIIPDGSTTDILRAVAAYRDTVTVPR